MVLSVFQACFVVDIALQLSSTTEVQDLQFKFTNSTIQFSAVGFQLKYIQTGFSVKIILCMLLSMKICFSLMTPPFKSRACNNYSSNQLLAARFAGPVS
uniref:Uncharacterized protein n=1 Tax=Manihot esculenta TaxID=3983 RepID=A0A2C9UGM0_MANES